MAEKKARVIEGTNNTFFAECDGRILCCTLKSKRLATKTKYYNPIAPGDWVFVHLDLQDESKAQITSLCERKTEFLRLNVKKNLPQVIAANANLILAVTTPKSPNFKPGFVERVLVQAKRQDIKIAIVCNKCDLLENMPQKKDIMSIFEEWKKLGIAVFFTCATSGTGIEQLKTVLSKKDTLTALIGQSGVGKSSLVNALLENDDIATGAISQKCGKGRHTTTKGSLICLDKENNSFLIDTPGVKNFCLFGIKKEDLPLYFPLMKDLVCKCSFGLSCTHTHEKGCAVLQSLKEKKISQRLYETYLKITQELE